MNEQKHASQKDNGYDSQSQINTAQITERQQSTVI